MNLEDPTAVLLLTILAGLVAAVAIWAAVKFVLKIGFKLRQVAFAVVLVAVLVLAVTRDWGTSREPH